METERISTEDEDTAEEILLPLGYQTKHHGALKIGRETHAISMTLDVYQNNGTKKFSVKDVVYGMQYLDWKNFQRTVLAYSRVGVVVDLSMASEEFKQVWRASFPDLPNVVGLGRGEASSLLVSSMSS